MDYEIIKNDETNDENENENVRWLYKIREGRCENSLALKTAHSSNLPSSILKRAHQLLQSQIQSQIQSKPSTILSHDQILIKDDEMKDDKINSKSQSKSIISHDLSHIQSTIIPSLFPSQDILASTIIEV